MLLGYTIEEYKQFKDQSLRQVVYQDDLDKVEKHISDLTLLRENHTAEISFRLVRKDGKIISVHSKELIYNRDRNGKPIHILGIIRNVNDLMQQNAPLPNFELIVRALGNALQNPILVFDKAGHLVYANDSLFDQLQVDKVKWSGLGWIDSLKKESKSLVKEKIADELTAGKESWRLRLNFEDTAIHVLAFSRLEVQGQIIGFVASLEAKVSEKSIDAHYQDYNRFNTLMDLADFSIFSVDSELKYTSINKGHKDFLLQMFNATIKEGDKMKLFENALEEESALLVAYFKRAFDGEKFSVIESFKLANDATLEFTFSPIQKAQGKIEEVVVVLKDISHSKSMEKLMKYYEGNFKEVFNNSPDAIYVEDYQGNILAVNPMACKIQNMEMDELLGKNILQITPKGFEAQVAEDFRKMVAGEIDTLEGYTWREGSNPLAIEIKCSHIHYGEKPAMLLHVRNISARKVAEQNVKNLHQVIEESGDFIVMVSPEGKIIYSNRAFNQRIGEIDHSLNFLASLHSESDHQNLMLKAMNHAKDNGSWSGEMEIMSTDGQVVPCSQIIMAHRDERGNLMFFSTVLRDISEVKRTQDTLLKAKNMAEEAAKAKELFLTNMSHEIRTPMNGIVGLTEVLLQSNLNENQFEMLKAIRNSGDNLLAIINDILDLAKITSGKMDFERKKFILKDVVSNVVKLHESKVYAKGLSLNFALDPKIPNEVVGDSVKLSQILNNLVGNAVKFTESGRIELLVTKGFEKPEGILLNFLVKDTGIGIPEHKLPFVFDSFTQVSNETTRRFGGTGLGLTITKQLVELQGGSIQVESKEGRGSLFSINLLFGREKVEVPNPANPQRVYQDEPQYDFKRARVLIAEDNSVNQLLMKRIMEKLNMEADLAENGERALRMLEEKEYDLVLMDMQMPEMDGYMATEYIRKGESQVKSAMPIIAITANSSIEDAKKCFKAGVNDYISKPFKQGELIEKLSKFLPFEKL
jgi:PAS domain S-box-containing protein